MSSIVGMAFPSISSAECSKIPRVNYVMASFSGFDKPLCSNPSKIFSLLLYMLPIVLGSYICKSTFNYVLSFYHFLSLAPDILSAKCHGFLTFLFTITTKLREQLCQLDAQTPYNTSPWPAVCPLPPTFNYYLDYT